MRINSWSQQAFTLIELVMVMIILAVLAVVVAPKFINLKTDSKTAILESLGGAMQEGFSQP